MEGFHIYGHGSILYVAIYDEYYEKVNARTYLCIVIGYYFIK